MKALNLSLLFLIFLFHYKSLGQQIAWQETFDVFEKGYWGDGTGNATGDMSGITKWTMDVTACSFADAADYIKTVSTGEGRMQAVDINGEAVWASEIIDISAYNNLNISVNVSETGSSTSTNKYVKLYYKLNGGAETLFETRGSRIGNFGDSISSQTKLNGNNLQIIARINNPNAGDACIFDNVTVSFDNVKPEILSVIATTQNSLKVKFSEPIDESSAETIGNYNIAGIGSPNLATLSSDNSTADLTFTSSFSEGTIYTINISGVTDLNENTMDIAAKNFVYKSFKLEKVYIVGQDQLLVVFSRPLNLTSAETESNYSVNSGIGNPSAATLLSDTVVRLTFSTSFSNNQDYQIAIDNLSNIYGVVLNGANSTFTYHFAQEFDLLINELMVDISPAPNVLPAAKYIEIYNRSNFNIYLSGWTMQIGDNSPIDLPDFTLGSKDYIIICSSSQSVNFNQFGKTLAALSESQLITSGVPVALYNKQGRLIDYVKYSNAWYGNPEKAGGGWSLERIDSENFCGSAQNWRTSTNFKGGTPGAANSVSVTNPDNSKPALLSVNILSSYKLALNFSKNISQETGLNPVNYQLDNGLNLPAIITFPDSSRSTIILQFARQFIDGQEQSIQISNLKDFCGNTIDQVSGTFTYHLIYPKNAFSESDKIVHIIFSKEVEIVSAQMTQNYMVNNGMGNPATAIKHSTRLNEVYLEFFGGMASGQAYSVHIESIRDLDGNFIKPVDLSFTYFEPTANDLVINEILFNPRSSGVDFVEIYNKSSYPVDLSRLSIATRDDNKELESTSKLSVQNFLLEPYHFLAITTDTLKVKNEYPAISFDKFLQVTSIPSFNDDEGTIVILNDELVVDEFEYNANMHFALITNPEGVSLERVDPDKATQLASNWHSAAENYGYASPANQNSQFRKLSENMGDEIVIEPETFSPNSDGYDDVVFIRYKFNEPGYVANVSIYDGKGRLVKRIASNELLAAEGEFSWDGLYENGGKTNIGIYIIYFEIFNLQGVVKKYKKVCVVADRLK